MSTRQPIYTVGHSSQPIEAFMSLLQANGIEILADVRSTPYSRRYPHFSREALQNSWRSPACATCSSGANWVPGATSRNAMSMERASYEEIAKLPNFVRGIERVLEGPRNPASR
jgi:uncharacterized protein (DUF488 family)